MRLKVCHVHATRMGHHVSSMLGPPMERLLHCEGPPRGTPRREAVSFSVRSSTLLAAGHFAAQVAISIPALLCLRVFLVANLSQNWQALFPPAVGTIHQSPAQHTHLASTHQKACVETKGRSVMTCPSITRSPKHSNCEPPSSSKRSASNTSVSLSVSSRSVPNVSCVDRRVFSLSN